jgi:regulatory protein
MNESPRRKERPPRTLKQRAIGMLARREYSRAELATRLAATGAARSDIDPVLEELERAGYLSDTRFASAVVRQKAGGYSKRAIAHALREKGVTAPVAKDALAALDGADEFAQALALWQRRFGKAPADEREKARQVRFLVSRGYATNVVFRVLRAAGVAADEWEAG